MEDIECLDLVSIEDEIEVMHLVQEVVDLDQVAEFLLFCGLSNDEIIDRATAYLRVTF